MPVGRNKITIPIVVTSQKCTTLQAHKIDAAQKSNQQQTERTCAPLASKALSEFVNGNKTGAELVTIRIKGSIRYEKSSTQCNDYTLAQLPPY